MCTVSSYLVDPGNDGVLGVIRQFLHVPVAVRGFGSGKPVDAGHDPLYAHHLHSVGHHQSIYQSQMGTLQTQCENKKTILKFNSTATRS